MKSAKNKRVGPKSTGKNSKAKGSLANKIDAIVKNTRASVKIEGIDLSEDEVYALMDKAKLRYQASLR